MIDRSSPEYEKARWRVKISHFTEQGFDINGVVHVGANDGYEIPWYFQLGVERVMAFEPLPRQFRKLYDFYAEAPSVIVLPFALSDRTELTTLHVTEGDGKGSSLLYESPSQSAMVASQRRLGDISVLSTRFDALTPYYPTLGLYNCCVIDVQGLELQVLKGMGREIHTFDFFNIECSASPVYIGEAAAAEIIAYMDQRGFIQDTPVEPHNDVMFVSKRLKQSSTLKWYIP